MSAPIAWPEAQRICDIPEVREALDKFAVDACDENMLAMVSAIMSAGSRPREWTDPVSLGSVNRDYDQGFADGCSESKRLNEHLVVAFAQGRAAGLEEAAKVCEKLGDDYDMKESYKWPELKSDAYTGCQDCESAIRALITSPTSSDAGKDDARDAARYRWLRTCGEAFDVLPIFDLRGNIEPETLDSVIDAALSSLEVIGKGEKNGR